MQVENFRPPVLCISGLDPSGGAGLQADIESIAYCGGHALPIASCLTVQSSVQANSISPVEPQLIQKQAEVLLQDMRIASCKVGVIPNEAVAITIADILSQLPGIPVVFDPVLSASNGISFADTATIDTIKDILLPNVTVVTPNYNELDLLIGSNADHISKAQSLCALGPKYVFTTGADEQTESVHNTLFTIDGVNSKFKCPRLPNIYHGSGCTLSSALACYLALDLSIIEAVEQAQKFAWQSLKLAESIGSGQWIPKRIHHHKEK